MELPPGFTLCDLVRAFVSNAAPSSLPSFRDRRWHELLFELKRTDGWEFIGWFDWDGPYPKSAALQAVEPCLLYLCRLDLRTGRLFPNEEFCQPVPAELKPLVRAMTVRAKAKKGFLDYPEAVPS